MLTHEALVRAVEALERIAAADERRNELLIAEAQERRESWARSEQETAERFDRIIFDLPSAKEPS